MYAIRSYYVLLKQLKNALGEIVGESGTEEAISKGVAGEVGDDDGNPVDLGQAFEA